MARKQTRAALLKDLDAIQTRLRNLEKAEGERIGRIALKVGLGELELDEATLTTEFQAIVGRFQEGSEAGAETDPAPSTGRKSRSGAASVEA